MEIQNRVLEKVRKLLALANSNANVNEAAAAAARAQELLFQHKLSMADIEISGGEVEAVGKLNVDEETALQLKWKQQLMGALALGCYCKVITAQARGANGQKIARMILVGKPADTQTVAYLYEYARKEIDRLCAIQTAGLGFAFANSFRLGACSAIWDAMKAKRAEQEKPAANTSETALVLIKRGDAEIEKFIAKSFSNLRKGPAVRASRVDAFGAGVEAGRSIDLNGGHKALGAESKRLPV